MIIAIPVDENSLNTGVCISFGRAPHFMVFDTDTNKGEFYVNSAAESQGGAGVKAAQSIVDFGADVLLTPRCGDNAVEVFKAAGIKMYKTNDGLAMVYIKAFLKGDLSLLTESHPGFHGHGG
jgi:predicted Fe-Mo cluster-binding NifX family protein